MEKVFSFNTHLRRNLICCLPGGRFSPAQISYLNFKNKSKKRHSESLCALRMVIASSSLPISFYRSTVLSSGDEVVCGAHKCGLVGERINWGLDHQSPFLAHVSHPKESVTTTTLLSPLTSEWRRRREIGRAFKVGIFILSAYFILTSETTIFRNSTPFICKRSDNLEITLRRAIKAATSIDLRILRS